MSQYSVCVEYTAAEALPDALLAQLQNGLAPYAAVVTRGPAAELTVTLSVEHDTPLLAVNRGAEHVDRALLSYGAPSTAMRGLSAQAVTGADHRTAPPPFPELAGTAEAAQILGIGTAGASKLRDALQPHLVQVLASGPVYRADGVREYAATTTRKSGPVLGEIPLGPRERDLFDALAAASCGGDVRAGAPSTVDGEGHIEGTAGNGSQFQIHLLGPGSPFAAALGALAEHGLVRARQLLKKEAAQQGADHHHDLVVSLTAKGRRRSPSR
jgi:hypothetical protein